MRRPYAIVVVLLMLLTVLACGATPVAAPPSPAATAAAATATLPGATPTPAATATLPGATATPAPTVSASGGSEDAVIALRRSGGIAGRADAWTIHGDGRVIDAKGDETRVDPTAVQRVLDQATAAGFFALDVSLPKTNTCSDCFTYQLSITAGGQDNSITWQDAQADVPQAVWDLEAAVKALVDSAK